MSTTMKYQVSRVLVAVSVPVICYCLAQMIPAGLAGNSGEAKRWFTIVIIAAAIGMISLLVMRYSKSLLDAADSEPVREVEILSAAAAEMARQKQAAGPVTSPVESSSKTPPKV
jgi:uncharacterized membrane protein